MLIFLPRFVKETIKIIQSIFVSLMLLAISQC